MSKLSTVKKAPKSKSMKDAVKAIRVESGIKAGKEAATKGPLLLSRGG